MCSSNSDSLFFERLEIDMSEERSKPEGRARVLVLGASGLNGGALAALLDEVDDIEVVRGARDPRTVAAWKDKGKTAVRIDLDDPLSFPEALVGVDRLFLMTATPSTWSIR